MAKPVAAYRGKLSIGGTSTSMTAEACSLVSGKTYKVTSSTKRILDPSVARTWKDGGVAVSASNIESEDLMMGRVTFISSYTPSGAITLDGSYLPRTAVAWVTSLKMTLKAMMADVSDINQAGYRKRIPTMFEGSGQIELADNLFATLYGTSTFYTLFTGRTPVLLEMDLDGGTNCIRMWVNLEALDPNTKPEDVVRGSVGFVLAAQGSSTAYGGIGVGAI